MGFAKEECARIGVGEKPRNAQPISDIDLNRSTECKAAHIWTDTQKLEAAQCVQIELHGETLEKSQDSETEQAKVDWGLSDSEE